MTVGGSSRFDPCPLQATKPPLSHEAWSQQVRIQSEVEVQVVAAMPKLVEDAI